MPRKRTMTTKQKRAHLLHRVGIASAEINGQLFLAATKLQESGKNKRVNLYPANRAIDAFKLLASITQRALSGDVEDGSGFQEVESILDAIIEKRYFTETRWYPHEDRPYSVFYHPRNQESSTNGVLVNEGQGRIE